MVLLLCGGRELPARDLISTEEHKVGGCARVADTYYLNEDLMQQKQSSRQPACDSSAPRIARWVGVPAFEPVALTGTFRGKLLNWVAARTCAKSCIFKHTGLPVSPPGAL